MVASALAHTYNGAHGFVSSQIFISRTRVHDNGRRPGSHRCTVTAAALPISTTTSVIASALVHDGARSRPRPQVLRHPCPPKPARDYQSPLGPIQTRQLDGARQNSAGRAPPVPAGVQQSLAESTKAHQDPPEPARDRVYQDSSGPVKAI